MYAFWRKVFRSLVVMGYGGSVYCRRRGTPVHDYNGELLRVEGLQEGHVRTLASLCPIVL